MIFGALVVLLIGLTLAFLIIPVLNKPTTEDSIDREQQNIIIAKDKKALIEEQLAQGQMTQSEYQSARADLEAALAIDLERQQSLDTNLHAGKWVVWVFVPFIPVLSIFMYYQLGEYRVIENPQLAQVRTQMERHPAQGSAKAPSMDELIDKLKNHLRDNPEDTGGWFMLGRTLMSLQQYPGAVTAFQRSYDLSGNEPSIMLALADAMAMMRDGDMSGDPEQLVLKALALSPQDITALWLAGLSAEQAGHNRQAYDYWMRLLPMLNDDPRSAAEVKTLLVALKKKQPDLPELDIASPIPITSPDLPSNGLNVLVSLDQKFASQVNSDDRVFIYAKASPGPPMPLAAKRLKVSDLPIQVSLSDSDAMMSEMKMSGFDQIIVGARISKSGNPVGQAGDLFNESEAIEHKGYEGAVEIRIDRVKQ